MATNIAKYQILPIFAPDIKSHTMKYLIRAIKYFFYFAIVTTAIVATLVLIGAVEGNIESIFEGGYNALWKMAIFFAAVAAVYPSLAFIRRDIPAKGDFRSRKDEIIGFMKERRYELENENDGRLSFRVKGIAGKLSKMYEDRIIITNEFGGIQIEGLRKDVIRIASGLDLCLNRLEEQQED